MATIEIPGIEGRNGFERFVTGLLKPTDAYLEQHREARRQRQLANLRGEKIVWVKPTPAGRR